MPLHVAVDGRNLVRPVTGIARYCLGLIGALVPRGHRFTIYLPSKRWPDTDYPSGCEFVEAAAAGLAAKAFWGAWHLPRDVNRSNPDLFWGPSHRLPPGLRSDIPTVVTIHDLVWKHAGATMPRLNYWTDRLLMPRAIRRADIVCVNSAATGDAVRSAFPSESGRVRLVYPSIHASPLPEPAAGLQHKLGLDRPYFLFVGTLEPRKNLAGLITAFARLPDNVSQACLLVIAGGRGWGNQTPAGLARDAGIADRVRIADDPSDAELEWLYAHARARVMPSLHEGFGLPIVEANRQGVPAIVGDNSSMPEIGGEAALCVDAEAPDALADAMARLYADDALHRRLASAALANAGRFGSEAGGDAMEAAFEAAIAARGARHRG